MMISMVPPVVILLLILVAFMWSTWRTRGETLPPNMGGQMFIWFIFAAVLGWGDFWESFGWPQALMLVWAAYDIISTRTPTTVTLLRSTRDVVFMIGLALWGGFGGFFS